MTKSQEHKDFEKVLKIMYELAKSKDPYENAAKSFIEEFAYMHNIKLKQ